jgi:hypothetical protein
MFNLRKRMMVVVVLAIVAALLITGYAFAATNTVPPTNLGDGSNVISGYTISNVHYTLDPAAPQTVTDVSFTIAPGIPAGGTVYVRLVAGGNFFSCDTSGGTAITCALTGVTALAADELTVVSGQ